MILTADSFYRALPGLLAAASAFAVCAWRIGDLSRRVDRLESSERNHNDRMVVVETQLKAAVDLLQRIADKLNVD